MVEAGQHGQGTVYKTKDVLVVAAVDEEERCPCRSTGLVPPVSLQDAMPGVTPQWTGGPGLPTCTGVGRGELPMTTTVTGACHWHHCRCEAQTGPCQTAVVAASLEMYEPLQRDPAP
jgi:hypothetical protein